jgi:F0F1-type ATP synthase membrane subunit b/b'
MHEQLVRHKRQNDFALKQEAEKMKDHLRSEARREASRIEHLHEARIAERLKKRDGVLRAQFEKECSLKYEKLLAQKQAQLNRKKLLLEREVMGNLRKVLS